MGVVDVFVLTEKASLRKMVQTVLRVFVLVCALATARAWINEVDQRANFTCPNGQMLYHITSEHVNSAEDRRWDFGCRDIHVEGDIEKCMWSGFVNEVDKPLNYACEGEGYITGIDSIHYNSAEEALQLLLLHSARRHGTRVLLHGVGEQL